MVDDYRCYFLDKEGRVLGPAMILRAPNDDDAVAQAVLVCDIHPHCTTLELWLGDRLVHTRDILT